MIFSASSTLAEARTLSSVPSVAQRRATPAEGSRWRPCVPLHVRPAIQLQFNLAALHPVSPIERRVAPARGSRRDKGSCAACSEPRLGNRLARGISPHRPDSIWSL